MPESEFYDEVESLARRLVSSLSGFSPRERDEVSSFLDAGEYGLAIETASAIVLEEARPLSRVSLELIRDLVAKIGIDDTVDINRLEVRVVE